MSPVIPYHSATPNRAPSEFDFHFEREMTRRLRRRVLWYCGITIAVSLLFNLPGLLTGSGRPIQFGVNAPPAPRSASVLQHSAAAISLLMYIAVLVVVWFKPFARDRLLRLMLWLYVLASIPGLIGTRVIFQLAVPTDMADQIIAEQLRDRERRRAIDAAGLAPPEVSIRQESRRLNAADPSTQPASRPATNPANQARVRSLLNIILQPAMFFAVAVPFIFLIHHTFVCLFIPWTLRQSLAPAIILLAIATAILLVDLGNGLHWLAPVIGVPIAALMLVPGSLFCWWRYRGMSRDIRLTYDSERLRTIQAELNSAKRILEGSLPPMRTAGPVRVNYVYEPMRQIGGDLLFVYPPTDKDEGPVSVVLLDVTGHGIAAALSVNRLIGELERLFGESPDSSPADVLRTLNNYVYYTMARHDMYVTAVALKIDPANNVLIYGSAGHPTAFMRRLDGTIVELESTTMLLGIVDNDEFSPDALTLGLQNGDCIVAYTDGASEAKSDRNEEMLGMTGVRRSIEAVAATGLQCNEWPTEIMRRVAAFRNAPPLDDTLLVSIHRL